jgi:hypothetical protein
LAPFPGLPRTLAALHAFPRGFEAFYNDHFGFRERLVALYSRAMVRLGISPTTQVVIGRDGWFFYASPGDGNALEDYRNNDPLTEAELAVWERDLRAKRDWLASRGIAYLFVIAPSKSTVYGEFMPANIRRVSDVSRADQLVARARQADLPVLDLRPVLLTQKAGGALLYDKAGSHWNAWGANLAQAALAEGLVARGVTLAPQRYALADFAAEPAGGETDLAGMMGLGEAFRQPTLVLARPQPLCTQTPLADTADHAEPPHQVLCAEAGPVDALIFRDSFYTALQPYMAAYFRQATYVWVQPTLDDVQHYVAQTHPQVVIEERAERYLWQGLTH